MEDVIIVGAGPAGLACAKKLAASGINPLVFEKDGFGEKTCGDTVGEKWFKFSINPYLNKKSIEKKFEKFVINFYGKKHYSKGKWYTINREIFEREIYEEAKELGAEFIFEPVEKIRREEQKIVVNDRVYTKCLVGADGVDSTVRDFLGQKIVKTFAIRGYAEVDKQYPTIFIDKNIIEGGYAWSFPKSGETNIGVGSHNIKKVKESWEEFSRDMEVKNVEGGFIPYSLPKKTEFENILLVGDAAGQVDPFSWGGIALGLICGELAAESIINGESYEKLWRKKLLKHLMVLKLKSKLFWDFLMKFKKSKRLLRWFF